MKNFKSMPENFSVYKINSQLMLLILITVLLFFPNNSYSDNRRVLSNESSIKQIEFPCLDSIKKRKVTSSNFQNPSERLIIKLNELDKLAEFPGGMEKFYEKVTAKLDASELSYTGFTQIHASFIIEKDGSMSGIVVDSTLDSELKKEIIDGLKSIKAKWSPAIQDNKPIRITYSLPIVLNID